MKKRTRWYPWNKAWDAYRDAKCAKWTPRDEQIAKRSYVAGWKARHEGWRTVKS